MAEFNYITKTNSLDGGTFAILLPSNTDPDPALFNWNKDELDFIETQRKNKAEVVLLPKLNGLSFIQYINIENKELYKQKELARKAGHALYNELKRHAIKDITLYTGFVFDNDEMLLAFAEGLMLSTYTFNKYKTDKSGFQIGEVKIYSDSLSGNLLEYLNISIEATFIARDLVNEPVIYLTATQFSEELKQLGKKAGFSVDVFNKAKIESLKMGGLLSVNKGSQDPPTFNVLEYKPGNAVNDKPIVLVGKGLVYDTGGLSLKPTKDSMDSMKSDMGGGALVAGAFYALAKAKLPVHVIGLIPATDNRPGENAITPGDVITMSDGTTVEVLNTDAEGRLILADALVYAKKFNPELVTDFATLTGAAAMLVGHFGTVCLGNADYDTKKELDASANDVYERLVELPAWDEYGDLLKSDIADLKNIGGPIGGAITAGKFLENFVDYPWMHFDIAGPAFLKSPDTYKGKNGTGTGVRFMFNFLTRRAYK